MDGAVLERPGQPFFVFKREKGRKRFPINSISSTAARADENEQPLPFWFQITQLTLLFFRFKDRRQAV